MLQDQKDGKGRHYRGEWKKPPDITSGVSPNRHPMTTPTNEPVSLAAAQGQGICLKLGRSAGSERRTRCWP